MYACPRCAAHPKRLHHGGDRVRRLAPAGIDGAGSSGGGDCTAINVFCGAVYQEGGEQGMVPPSASEPDERATEYVGGCIREDGDDPIDAYTGSAFVSALSNAIPVHRPVVSFFFL